MQRIIVLLLLLVAAIASPAQAERRVALVIGNDAYANMPALRKAVADARAVRDVLAALGFDVLYDENVPLARSKQLFFDFSGKLSEGDVAFVFYSGHGVALGGANYLLPTDIPAVREPKSQAAIAEEEERLAEFAIPEAFVLQRIKAKGARVGIVVFDACRDNPLRLAEAANPFRSARPGDLVFGATRGLARLQAVPEGIFSIYSANFGERALDGLGANDAHPNSPFTRVFLKHLATPGKGLRTVMVETREEVVRLARSVGHEQRPALYDEVTGGDLFLAGEGAGQPDPERLGNDGPSADNQEGQVTREAAYWRAIEASREPDDFRSYVKKVESGEFSGLFLDLAHRRVKALTAVVVAKPKPSQQSTDAEKDAPIAKRGPSRIHTEGYNGPTFVKGSFTRVALDRWEERNTENKNNVQKFRTMSQTKDTILLFDESRKLWLRMDLKRKKLSWRPDGSNTWNPLYDIVKVEGGKG